LQGPLSVERMCYLTEVNRAGFYRYLRDGWWAEENMTLHCAVQNLLIEHRWRYGYRRVTAELRARGMLANHKRVVRIMSEDNLLVVYRNWHRPPDHWVGVARIYLNLHSTKVGKGGQYLRVRCKLGTAPSGDLSAR